MESSKVNLGGLLAKTKFKEEERKTLALIISMFLYNFKFFECHHLFNSRLRTKLSNKKLTSTRLFSFILYINTMQSFIFK